MVEVDLTRYVQIYWKNNPRSAKWDTDEDAGADRNTAAEPHFCRSGKASVSGETVVVTMATSIYLASSKPFDRPKRMRTPRWNVAKLINLKDLARKGDCVGGSLRMCALFGLMLRFSAFFSCSPDSLHQLHTQDFDRLQCAPPA